MEMNVARFRLGRQNDVLPALMAWRVGHTAALAMVSPASHLLALAFIARALVGQSPTPRILLVYRERPLAAHIAEFRRIEVEAATMCARLGCPHVYFGLEALTGPHEAWYLNGFESDSEVQAVTDAYAKQDSVMATMKALSARRQPLMASADTQLFVRYDSAAGRGSKWLLGSRAFVVVTMYNADDRRPHARGVVYSASDSSRFVFTFATSRERADVLAAARGGGTRILIVRPEWSMPRVSGSGARTGTARARH